MNGKGARGYCEPGVEKRAFHGTDTAFTWLAARGGVWCGRLSTRKRGDVKTLK